jgi:N-acetylmuramoyl-L-alanine amidase
VLLTIGSKVAVVNGVSKTMPIETIIVKNAANGSSYIMVPASYVASYLGYSYTWNSTSGTSVLSKRVVDSTPDEGTIPPSDSEMTYNEYSILGNYLSTYNQLKTTAQIKSINNSTNSSANIGDVTKSTEIYEDREVFYIKAYSSFSTLTSDYSANNAIVLNIPSSFASSKTYIFADSIIQSAAVTYDEARKNSKITFTTSVKQPRYDLELVDGGYTIKVTIYYNYINALKLYYDNYTDYATFDTLYPSTLNVSSDETNIYIDLPYTVNSLGTINSTINEGYCIKAVTASQMPNRTTRITITKTKTSAYYSNASGNTVTFNLLYDDETSSTDMKIEIPANVDYSVIDTEDLYMQKQFKIIIPGNYISFYKENPVTSYSSMISNIKVSLNSANCTEILVTTIALQGFRLTNNKTYIGVEVGDPQDIYSNIVVLDAGHGGSDKGAINYAAGVYEKNITLPIAYTYAKDYFNSKDSNIKVYWTRTNDTFISLDDRAAFAKKVGADLFISVHMNSVDSTTVKGSEVFYSTMNNTVQDSGISSKAMAQSYLNKIIGDLNFVNRGVKTANYYVLKNNSVPSVLIEFGFISNATDLSKLKNPSFQKEAAKLLYNVTNDLFLKYPTGR